VHLIILALAALIAFGGSLGTKSTSSGPTAPVAASAPLPSASPAPMDIAAGGGPSAPLP
jgi:hypothetical protein